MSLDLNKLANKLDEALSNETSETLTKFLTDKRMSKVKLYTEEHLKIFYHLGKIDGFIGRQDDVDELIKNYPPIELPSDSLCINCDESESTHNICMDCIIKIGKENIELPSDEEIEKEARLYCNIKESLVLDEKERYYKDFQKYDGFKACAKWMRDKIQGGNNEQH